MAKKKVNPDRVAALYTHVGEVLVLRANPTEEEVLGFVAEHTRRYYSGEPGGPSGIPPYLIHKVVFYDSESDIYDDSKNGPELDISSALPKIEFPNT